MEKTGQEITKKLFKLVGVLILIIHCMIFAVTLYLGITPMVYYNVFSIISYIVCLHFVDKGYYNQIFLFAYLEIILHSYIAAVCIGWTFGFALYMIALVPVGFYMEYFISEDKHNIRIPFLLGIMDFLIFVVCQTLASFVEPKYTGISELMRQIIYSFNAMCAFGMLLGFSVIFLQELNSNHDRLKAVNEKLNKMAKVDVLTGLFNRRGIKPFLDKCADSGVPFCVGMCDIDDFKHVNDSYGHDVGDEVIAEVARIIRADIKPEDHVCRWGGEEFVFLVDQSGIEEAAGIAEKIRSDVESGILEVYGKKISFTITIGVAEYMQGEEVDKTIIRADERMYSGKRSGKNKVVSG